MSIPEAQRPHPHMVRSHKYGGQLMTLAQMRALEALQPTIRRIGQLWQEIDFGTGWTAPTTALIQHVTNRLRVDLVIPRIAVIGPDQAERALSILHELECCIEAFGQRPRTWDEGLAFIRTEIDAGRPWTPSIRRWGSSYRLATSHINGSTCHA